MNSSLRFSIVVLFIGTLLTGFFSDLNVALAVMDDGQQDAQERSSTPKSSKKAQQYHVIITGNSHFTENDLLRNAAVELRMFEERGYRKADIDDAAFQMRMAYIEQGFAFASVDYELERQDGSIRVIFTIEEGSRVFIEQIDFTGNTAVSSEILQGFFPMTSARWGRQQQMVFVESKIKDGVSKVREYYRGEGFMDAVVEKPVIVFDETRSFASVSININEGPRYTINKVVFSGDLLPELQQELEKIRLDFTGRTFFIRRKLMLRTSLDEAYDAIGFAHAEFEIEAEKMDEPGRINLKAQIESGKKVTIAEVLISGNDSTREAFIRHRLQLEPDDIYTKAKRRESFRKLYDTGLFSRITIELSETGKDDRRNLEVAVEELPTREYFVEPGWGSYERARLRAGIFEKNLFGTGRYGRIDGVVSTKSETITLSYTDPWLLQTDIAMNVPVFYQNREEPSYTSEEIGLSVLFSKKLGDNLTLTTGYQYKITQLFSLADDSPLPQGEDDYIKGTIGIQAVWDTRDDIFYPAEGLRLASGFDLSLPTFGSDLEFGRITLGCRYFIELPQEYILGLRATTGLIIPIRDQDYIPISERFFNGGDNTVRSYEHSQLGPKDDNNEPIGGLGYNVFSIELRKRFYKDFSVTVYADAGNVSPNRSLLENDFAPYTTRSELLDDTLNDFFSEFKFGIGVGLQYLLPVGPIRFDVAYNPDPEEVWNEDSWVYHFSLGMAF